MRDDMAGEPEPERGGMPSSKRMFIER